MSPLKMADHTTYPKAVTVRVCVAASTAKAAAGCPLSPGMVNWTWIRFVLRSSVHRQPWSSTDGRREVDSYPEDVVVNISAGKGASKSSMVNPRSETSTDGAAFGVFCDASAVEWRAVEERIQA